MVKSVSGVFFNLQPLCEVANKWANALRWKEYTAKYLHSISG